MKLQLESSKVTSVYLGVPEIDEQIFKLDYSVKRVNEKQFEIEFVLEMVDPNVFEMALAYSSIFHADSALPNDEEFKNNKFFYQNAPAIAYPYLRSFVSTIMLNAGYSPLILPSINFVELSKQKQK